MRAVVLLGAALAVLGLPPAATAKGMTTVRVCGSEGCAILEDRARASQVTSPQETVFEPPQPARYYRLDITLEAARQSYRALFVPSAGLIAADEGARRVLLWYVPRTEALQQLHAATRHLEPYEAPSSWPDAVAAPGAYAGAETGRHGDPYGLLTAAALLALAGGAICASQIRIRRPKIA